MITIRGCWVCMCVHLCIRVTCIYVYVVCTHMVSSLALARKQTPSEALIDCMKLVSWGSQGTLYYAELYFRKWWWLTPSVHSIALDRLQKLEANESVPFFFSVLGFESSWSLPPKILARITGVSHWWCQAVPSFKCCSQLVWVSPQS
jgi:hypothetical protein